MRRVAIIGGGITGLTAAYTLERETDLEIVLIEASTELGGKIQTTRRDGFTIEVGPDSIFTGKPGALELIKELGLENEMVEPTASGFQLLVGGKLYPVPPGLASLAGISHEMIDQASFLSEAGKARAEQEPIVPPGDGKDESIRDFFTRRFGHEFSRLVAEPILAGTHGGDPQALSMRALYPHYLDREKRDGNLSTRQQVSHRPQGPMFISFKDGMATLTGRLANALQRTAIRTGFLPAHVRRASRAVEIDGTEFDHTLLTIPARNAAHLVDGDAAEQLGRIRFGSSVIVTAAYPLTAIPRELCGTGFLTPFDEAEVLTGCTWSSSKWPSRAPEGHLLIRFFFGGDGRPALGNDEELIRQTEQHAARILGISSSPNHYQVSRWDRGLPLYELGHIQLIDKIEESLADTGISVAGASYRGVGIPDCIRQGREAARRIAEALN